jgi:hypothetical protein
MKMTKDSDPELLDVSEINTMNEFLVSKLPDEITPQLLPRLRTRQQAYRFAAWCQVMGEQLPPEDGDHSYREIRNAIRNT